MLRIHDLSYFMFKEFPRDLKWFLKGLCNCCVGEVKDCTIYLCKNCRKVKLH